MSRRLGITASGMVLVVLVVLGWIVALNTGGRASFLLLYGMLVVLGISWFLGRRRPSVEAIRSDLPTRVTAGQLVAVELNLTPRRGFSNVIVEESLPPALGRSARVAVPSLSKGKTVTHHYSFVPRCRGVHKVGPTFATWGDPFGLTKRRAQLAEASELIVHPALEPVADRVLARQWEDPPIRPPVQKPWPSGFEFYGMRDYVPGDDPRRIVWRASARTIDPVSGEGHYLVRESEQGITDRVALILDNDVARHSKQDPSDTFEAAVSLVASLGVRHLRDGFAVTVDANGARIGSRLRGSRSRIPLLDTLARLEREPIPLSTAVDRIGGEKDTGRHIVVVTPYLDEQTAARLRLMIKKGGSVLAALIVGDEFDPASAERAVAIGCNLVQIRPGVPFEGGFRKMVGLGVHRAGPQVERARGAL